jgi:hypothetical protein
VRTALPAAGYLFGPGNFKPSNVPSSAINAPPISREDAAARTNVAAAQDTSCPTAANASSFKRGARQTAAAARKPVQVSGDSQTHISNCSKVLHASFAPASRRQIPQIGLLRLQAHQSLC